MIFNNLLFNHKKIKNLLVLFILFVSFLSCSKESSTSDIPIGSKEKNLTIFIVNDVHGQIDNFSKIKFIVDKERLTTNVILTSSGDMFSGNPVVDNYPQKGYPIIDLMNRVGFDVMAIGNHEFDYGETYFKDRMLQANFSWICANVSMGSTGIPEPLAYKTIAVADIKITFLGLLETNGKDGEVIPSTHPWRVQNFTFEKPEDVVSKYANIKNTTNSDLYVALTHLGYNNNYGSIGDYQLATLFPYFDLIIGGHSHSIVNTTVNQIPIFQAGSNLNYLGKIVLKIKDKKITSLNYDLINLNSYSNLDADIQTIVNNYNSEPFLKEVIGYSTIYHNQEQVGCFVADALRGAMKTDISFQNTGGVRASLIQGDITKREIYEIAPFNNGTVIYSMTISEIKNFLKGSKSGFYYSGVNITQNGSSIIITDTNQNVIPDTKMVTVGVLDYIPAVYDAYFPQIGDVQPLTDAETIIYYLQHINSQVNYPIANHYFKYN